MLFIWNALVKLNVSDAIYERCFKSETILSISFISFISQVFWGMTQAKDIKKIFQDKYLLRVT